MTYYYFVTIEKVSSVNFEYSFILVFFYNFLIRNYSQVTNESDVLNAIALAKEKFGRIRAVVNCAGIAVAKRTLTKSGPHPYDDFAKVILVTF